MYNYSSSVSTSYSTRGSLTLISFQLLFIAASILLGYYVVETIVGGHGSVELLNFSWITALTLILIAVGLRSMIKRKKISLAFRAVAFLLLTTHIAFISLFIYASTSNDNFKAWLYRKELLERDFHSYNREFWNFKHTRLLDYYNFSEILDNPILKEQLCTDKQFVKQICTLHFGDYESQMWQSVAEGPGRYPLMEEAATLYMLAKRTGISPKELCEDHSSRIVLLGALLAEYNPGNESLDISLQTEATGLKRYAPDSARYFKTGIFNSQEIKDMAIAFKQCKNLSACENELLLSAILRYPKCFSDSLTERVIAEYTSFKKDYKSYFIELLDARSRFKKVVSTATMHAGYDTLKLQEDYKLFIQSLALSTDSALKSTRVERIVNNQFLYKSSESVYKTVTRTKTSYSRTTSNRYSTATTYTTSEQVYDHTEYEDVYFANDTMRIKDKDGNALLSLSTPEFIYVTTMQTVSDKEVHRTDFFLHNHESWLFGLPWSLIK